MSMETNTDSSEGIKNTLIEKNIGIAEKLSVFLLIIPFASVVSPQLIVVN